MRLKPDIKHYFSEDEIDVLITMVHNGDKEIAKIIIQEKNIPKRLGKVLIKFMAPKINHVFNSWELMNLFK